MEIISFSERFILSPKFKNLGEMKTCLNDEKKKMAIKAPSNLSEMVNAHLK